MKIKAQNVLVIEFLKSLGRSGPDTPSTLPSSRRRVLVEMVMLVVMVLGAAASKEAAAQQSLSFEIGLEATGFFSEPLHAGQENQNASVFASMELFRDFDDGTQRLVFQPFFRADASDTRRTHFDLREAYWQYAGRKLELLIGSSKVFWGVAESVHLVDIINQTDGIESIDGEEKLGQPMIRTSLILNRGVLEVFVMPFFRERTFAGRGGRLRAPWIVEVDSGLQHERVDLAVRWASFIRTTDFGVSVFRGSSREPLFSIDRGSGSFVTDYPVITQVGVDIQNIWGSWLFKSEMLYRSGFMSDYFATSSGVEYTFSNIRASGWDVGALAEYHYDARDKIELGGRAFSTTALENDLFVGARLALNDMQSSEVLAGATFDTNSGERTLFLEASRRISNRVKAEVEWRMFQETDPGGPIHFLREDTYARFSFTYFY